MSEFAIKWHEQGARQYETGVERGVLYLPNSQGVYNKGVPWNGLTSVSESPEGAESNEQYADNTVYLSLVSAEKFKATINAFTYPDEFAECDGTAVASKGVYLGQQSRKAFGLSYVTKLGNDTVGQDYGRKIHLVYGLQAAPSEKEYSTLNDSPEAIEFSWECSSTPVKVSGYRSLSTIVVDSSKEDPTKIAEFEKILYGTDSTPAKLPSPDEVLAHFKES